MTSKGRLLLLLSLLLLLTPGCAPKNPSAPASVRGRITYKGKPLGGGTIAFWPEGGGMRTAPILNDGTYGSSDMPAGTMTVTIETTSVKPGPKLQRPGASGNSGSPAPGGSAPPSQAPTGEYVAIPAKYADKNTSGLSVTLTAGKQEKDFDLAD